MAPPHHSELDLSGDLTFRRPPIRTIVEGRANDRASWNRRGPPPTIVLVELHPHRGSTIVANPRFRSIIAVDEPTGPHGQSLVEFALVFPIFFILLLGIIEFAFVFNAMLAVNFASRERGPGRGRGREQRRRRLRDPRQRRGRHQRARPTHAASPRSRSTAPSPTATTTCPPRRRSTPGPARRPAPTRTARPPTVPYTRTRERLPGGQPLQHPGRLRRDPHHDRPHRRPDHLHPPVHDAARDLRRQRLRA